MKNFKLFVAEDYFANLAGSTADKKRAQIKKQAAMSDDDPDAYREMPGDTKGKRYLKTSDHTKKYHDLYSEQFVEEAFSTVTATGLSRQNRQDLIDLGATIKVVGPGYYITISDSNKKLILDYLAKHSIDIYEESLYEKEQSTDRSPIDNDAIETGLKNKSKETGVPIGILRAVMRRGMAAWKSGHRPGAGQEQWGYARCNSFITGGEGTWGRPLKNPTSGADSDLAKEAIKAGFMPK